MHSGEGRSGGKLYKRLDEAVVRPGDIILTTAAELPSSVIRFVTGSDISHAMICVADRSIIDSNLIGVHAHNMQRLFFEAGCAVYVLRPVVPLTQDELSTVTTYMRGHVGTEYAFMEAGQSLTKRGQQWTKKQYCSRLAAQAYAAAGRNLVENADFCSPADIQKSQALMVVPNATVSVHQAEVDRWTRHPDTTQLMRDTTNTLLEGARARNRAIQTLDDIDAHLFATPEDDAHLTSILSISGYLTVWKFEVDKNPWQYDLALMSEGPDDQIRYYCEQTLVGEDNGPNRYVVNRGGYQLYLRRAPLNYFRLMADLYDRLASLHL